MNLNVPTEIFDEVKKNYLELDAQYIDEKIRDIVMRFKDMPFFDKVCPRWSCQSHSNESNDSSYYIIFVTQGNGANILYKLYELLYSTFLEKYGCLYVAGNNFSVVPLMFTKKNNIDITHGPFPNIMISTETRGTATHIEKCIEIWNEVLDKMEKEIYE